MQKEIANELNKNKEVYDENLKKKLVEYNPENKEWEYAMVTFALGKWYRALSEQSKDEENKRNFAQEAEQKFRDAIRKLEKSYPREVRWHEMRVLLVKSLLNQNRYQDALQEAENALSYDPLDVFEHECLGLV